MRPCSVRLILLFALSFEILLSSGSDAFMTKTSVEMAPAGNESRKRQKLVPGKESNNSMASVSPLRVSPEERESNDKPSVGKLKELKQREAELSELLAAVRREKLSAIRSRPLTIGVVGFGRFGQFIARTFQKYGKVIVTSRSDYTEIANGMGVTYVPLSDPDAFFSQGVDVVVLAVSIMSFQPTLRNLLPHIQKDLERRAENGVKQGPLFVDVLSVKEHAREIMLDMLPEECDILCTHPMFGPDSGKNSWRGLNFVYERTRIDKVLLDPSTNDDNEKFVDKDGNVHSLHEDSEAHVEGMDRLERFLSIWEEEGCRMVPMSCKDHDAYAANSQFITHLMGRILDAQGLERTPIDTKGFESVLKLVGTTGSDSFELFYGLYKFNQNSLDTIFKLRKAMDDVVEDLRKMERKERG